METSCDYIYRAEMIDVAVARTAELCANRWLSGRAECTPEAARRWLRGVDELKAAEYVPFAMRGPRAWNDARLQRAVISKLGALYADILAIAGEGG